MAITVNTNMQALRIQTNLGHATTKMNTAMERMSSGYRINSAADDAAGLSVTTRMNAAVSSSKIASDNVEIGQDLLDTAEGTLNVIMDNLQRIRDLATEAANGTYATSDISAIKAEAAARAGEIDRMAGSAKFNGISLFGGSASTAGVTLQIGPETADTLTLDASIFASATSTGLGLSTTIASAFADSASASTFLTEVDTAIGNYTNRVTSIGAYQNRLSSISESLDVQQTNLTSSISTIKDADVAEESAAYVAQKILQSASATLLVQANAAPQIALTLIQG
jgi:flagellin